MATRTRVTTTIRQDNPVPRRRSRKKESSVGVVILILIALFFFARTNRPHGPQPQRVIAPR